MLAEDIFCRVGAKMTQTIFTVCLFASLRTRHESHEAYAENPSCGEFQDRERWGKNGSDDRSGRHRHSIHLRYLGLPGISMDISNVVFMHEHLI